MRPTQRLDRFQQRHPRAGFALAVIYKFADDQGGYLSALLTYYGFLSLFPLLLLLTTILNFVLHDNPQLQQRVVNSALGQFPVIGDQLARTEAHGISGSGVALVVGVVGTLYGALGVAQAAQNMMNVAWMVPRNVRPNPIMGRLRGLLLLGVVGLAVAGTTVLSALGGSAQSFGATVGAGVQILLVVAAVVVNAAVFTLGFKLATVKDVAWRDVAHGAVMAALCWQVLQTFGTAYVGHVVKHAGATNSVFALVLGLIAWIYLESVVVVLAVEVNVVRTLRLYPRALLSPFTDDVDLTHADESTYRGQAEAQRAKSFQDIDVSFEAEPDRQD
jgi:membrane protein